jgi:outer membrane lipoprotein-sorting protein
MAGGRERFISLLAGSGFRIEDRYSQYFDVLERVADTTGLAPDGRPRDEAGHPQIGQILGALDGRPRLLTTVWPAVDIDQPGPVQLAAASDVSERLLAAGLPAGVTVEVTSALQVYGRLNDLLLDDFARVTGMGLLLAGAVIVLHFRSAALALLAALPLAAAALVSLGLVSTMGWQVAPVTALFAAIVLGIGIDSSIHMLAHAGRAPDWNPERAVREAGPPVIVSALTTAAGFGALAWSSLPVVSSLGIVVAIAVLCCATGALTILPAVLSLMRRRRGLRVPAVALLFSVTLPAAGLAQSQADRILERLQQRYEDTEALSCAFEQTKTISHLVEPVRVRGSAVFQRPMFLKMELTGDEALTVYSNNRRVWLVERDTGNVEEFDLTTLTQGSRLMRMVPTVFLGDFADLRARFAAGLGPEGDGRRLILTARRSDEACRQIALEIDALDRPRWVLMRFSNGDQVDTRFRTWSRLPRVSDTWFTYRPGGRDGR